MSVFFQISVPIHLLDHETSLCPASLLFVPRYLLVEQMVWTCLKWSMYKVIKIPTKCRNHILI